MSGRAARPVLDRIAERVALTNDGCLVWLGPLDLNGYGVLTVGSRTDGSRRKSKVHRLLFELSVADVPVGLDLDHLCRNRACCNPEHLEPVTRRQNLARGFGLIGEQLRRSACIHGHDYTPANTYMSHGTRVCRACKAARARARRARAAA